MLNKRSVLHFAYYPKNLLSLFGTNEVFVQLQLLANNKILSKYLQAGYPKLLLGRFSCQGANHLFDPYSLYLFCPLFGA